MPTWERVWRMVTVVLAMVLLLGAAPRTALAQGRTDQVLITLDAEGTPVNDVLQILASRSGLNIVTSPDVQGRTISIHLRDTAFDEALNLVVRAAGLGYERVGNSILVADVQRLTTETGLVTRVFDLQYANAADVKKMLDVLTQDVEPSVAGNRLVVHASQSVVEQIADVIAQLDRKPGQILLEARLIEVNTSKLLDVGIDWEKITKYNTVVSEGDPGNSPPGKLPDDLNYIKADHTEDVHRQKLAFEVALDALLTNGAAKLLSHTQLVVLDNTPAEIFAGETVPVVITSLSAGGNAGGVISQIQLEKIDVGVKLTVTPRIAPDGYITTLVVPEVSRIVAFVGPDDDLPETSTRRARTLVRVRDGEKIYVGGLRSRERRSTVKKVPLVGDIPILGHLFRHYSYDDADLDLVIEITPTIVGDEGASLPQGLPAPIEGE
jgi:type II secretory pathway component GspD/PulD (secretin)